MSVHLIKRINTIKITNTSAIRDNILTDDIVAIGEDDCSWEKRKVI